MIVKPDEVATTNGLLFISGGSIDRPAPKSAEIANRDIVPTSVNTSSNSLL
jgi:hypothetical protein